MADFRTIGVHALKWLPLSRKTLPVTPIRVQVPPSQCSITLLQGRYGVDLTLCGHPAHAGFVRFLASLERHAQCNASPPPDLRWYPNVTVDSLVPLMKLSAFDGTKFFDAGGEVCYEPTAIQGCSCLLELSGAWTSSTSWGLRWKVLEIKQASAGPIPCMLDLCGDTADIVTLPATRA